MPPELASHNQAQDDTAALEAYLDADNDAFAAMGQSEDDAPDASADGSADDVAEVAEVDDAPEEIEAALEAKPTGAPKDKAVDDLPAWARAHFEAMVAQNARLEKLLESFAAGVQPATKPTPPPEPELPEAEQLMASAMALPAGHPDKADLQRAAAMAMLESEWSGNPDALAQVTKAKAAARQKVHGQQGIKTLQEQIAEAKRELGAMKRERSLENNWARVARALPTMDDERAQEAFPHARRLFGDPAALREFVLTEASKSDAPEHEAIGRALAEVEQALQDLDTTNPAELRAAARAMGRSDPLLRGVVMAYADALAADAEKAPTDTSAQEKPKSKKPTAPKGQAGGRVDPGLNDLERYLDMDDPREWNRAAARLAHAKA